MESQNIVNHKTKGLGLVVTMNALEDKSTRIFIVWQDVERANVLAGWYVFNEADFIKGENK